MYFSLRLIRNIGCAITEPSLRSPFYSETSCRPVATVIEAVRIAQHNVGVIMTFRTIAGYQCHSDAWNLSIAALGSSGCYAGGIVAFVWAVGGGVCEGDCVDEHSRIGTAGTRHNSRTSHLLCVLTF